MAKLHSIVNGHEPYPLLYTLLVRNAFSYSMPLLGNVARVDASWEGGVWALDKGALKFNFVIKLCK